MEPSGFVSLSDHLRALPAPGPGRDRRLQHLTGQYAAAEAATALRSAAASAAGDGLLGAVLSSASVAWDGGRADADPFVGDEAARARLATAVAAPEFLALAKAWARELRQAASAQPETGACTLATALQMWAWTMGHLRASAPAEWMPRAVAELADSLCPLVAARCLALDVVGRASSAAAADTAQRADLCHTHAAHAAASAGAVCAELVFGYRRHLTWDAEGCAACFGGDEVDELEGVMPGIACGARISGDVVDADGSHAAKAGPCARFDGVDTFVQLRRRLDGCLTGARIAKDRAAAALERAAAGTSPAPASTGGH